MPAVKSDIFTSKERHRRDLHCYRARTHLIEIGRLAKPLALDVEDVDARPGCVSADSERREAQRRRLARRGDKRPVHCDLELVVVRVQICGLGQEQQVLARRVPAHWAATAMGSAYARARGKWWGLTVVRDGVDPLVERGVELGDDVLLPLLPDEPEHDARLVDRVLGSQTIVNTCP